MPGKSVDTVSNDAVRPTVSAQSALLSDQPTDANTQIGSFGSIEDIVNSEPKYSPIEGMADQFWKTKNCSDCHNWNRESLCQQGNFYTSRSDETVDRIKHPLGGDFKQALKNWANNDCS